MDKQKIAEMAKDWDYVAHMLRFNDRYMLSLKEWSEPAREMIKLGWIKPAKDSVVLTREEFLNLTPKRKKILANRVYEDSTLMTWKKSDLIEHIRVLEQNWIGSLETIDIQAKNCEMLLQQASKETAEKILNELYCTPKEQVENKIKELAKFIGVEIKE